jgi:hypothetical protein
MSSEEFIAEAVQNKTGKNVGKRSIWFNGRRTDSATGRKIEYPYPNSISTAPLISHASRAEAQLVAVPVPDNEKSADGEP